MSLAARALPFSVGRSAFGWMGAANGEMEFGLNFVWGVVVFPSFREWVRTLGYLSAEMDWRVARTTGRRRMIVL